MALSLHQGNQPANTPGRQRIEWPWMSKALIRMLDRPNLKHHSRRGRSFRVWSLELHNRMEKPSSGKPSGRELVRLTLLLAALVVVILACSGLPAIQAAARNADASVGTLVEAINSRYS